MKSEKRKLTSHGRGRWFNPSRSNHSKSLKTTENKLEKAPFRGLSFFDLPYRNLIKFTFVLDSRGEYRGNGKKRGAA